MALSKNDLARELFGKSRIEEASTHARETHVITGTATEDSADGTVRVDFGGNAVTADGQQSVPVTTAGDIRRGDTVLATVVGASGTAKSPTVIGTPGGGDRTRSEIAAATKSATEAETKAAEAVTKAAEAEKKADSLEDTINSKADATVTLDDGSKAQLATLVKQNAAKIETKADATVKLDDGTDAELGTLVKQTAAGLTTKADATVTLDDGTTAQLGTTVTQDHKSLTTVIKNQDDLSTIIREDSTGVTVGKSEDGGKTYSTARAHVSSSGSFETVLPDGTIVASMGKDGQQIGNAFDTHLQLTSQRASIITREKETILDVYDPTDYARYKYGTPTAETFIGDGVTTRYVLSTATSNIADDYTLTVNGVTWDYVTPSELESTSTLTAYTILWYGNDMASDLKLKSAPENSAKITLAYYTYYNGYCNVKIGIKNSVKTGGIASGNNCSVTGLFGTAIGNGCTSSGSNSHAEGTETTASGSNSHAEGRGTTASGSNSHAEGGATTASGSGSHAEGSGTTASGFCSHAEGTDTTASSFCSHAEGTDTTASGFYSHAEGSGTTASGFCSHAEGSGTTAQTDNQTVMGRYNIADTQNRYLLIVGNGLGDSYRRNAFTVATDGTISADKTSLTLGTTLYSYSERTKFVSFDNGSKYELLVISAQTDDGTWVSQVVDTNDGSDFIVEFADAHWNDGNMYVKSATFHVYPAKAYQTIVWENGGVIQVNANNKASGQYFYIRRVVGLGKR